MISNHYLCVVSRVIDGDTVVLNINFSLVVILSGVHCRLVGINCPELHDPNPELKAQAQKAKDRSSALLLEGSSTFLDADGSKEKYRRLLVTIYPSSPSGSADSINAILLREGLAKPYTGGLR